MTAAVTSTLNAAGLLRVYINDALHLCVSTEKLVEVQSWKNEGTRPPHMFVIERTYAGGVSQKSDYDNEKLWRDVLGAIDKSFGEVRSHG